jgi:hypothetical protein
MLTVRFTGRLRPWEVPAFRGAIGRKVGAEGVLFHHHEGEKLRYAYPLIQYRCEGGRPVITCLGEGVEAIHQYFCQADWGITIGDHDLDMRVDALDLNSHALALSATERSYQISHWVALNQANHQRYQRLEGLAARIQFLEKKLVGNILAFAKGIDWYISDQVTVEITDLHAEPPMRIKGVRLENFQARFRTNVSLPAGIGLGAKVSIGMGGLIALPDRS